MAEKTSRTKVGIAGIDAFGHRPNLHPETEAAIREIFSQAISDPEINPGQKIPSKVEVEMSPSSIYGPGIGYTSKRYGSGLSPEDRVGRAHIAFDPLSGRPLAGSIAAQIENLIAMENFNPDQIAEARQGLEGGSKALALDVLREMEQRQGKLPSSVSVAQKNVLLGDKDAGQYYPSNTSAKVSRLARIIGSHADKFLSASPAMGGISDIINIISAKKRAEDVLGRKPEFGEVVQEMMEPGSLQSDVDRYMSDPRRM